MRVSGNNGLQLPEALSENQNLNQLPQTEVNKTPRNVFGRKKRKDNLSKTAYTCSYLDISLFQNEYGWTHCIGHSFQLKFILSSRSLLKNPFSMNWWAISGSISSDKLRLSGKYDAVWSNPM